MLDARQLVPAEEEQSHEGRLEEKRHEAFDGERCSENIAHIVAVIAPVHAELELHGEAGGDSEHEVDAEQRAPELGHLPPDRPARHHIDGFHDREDDRQPERERDEEEVIHRGHRELQAR